MEASKLCDPYYGAPIYDDYFDEAVAMSCSSDI